MEASEPSESRGPSTGEGAEPERPESASHAVVPERVASETAAPEAVEGETAAPDASPPAGPWPLGRWRRRWPWLVLALLAGFALHQWLTWPEVAALVERDPQDTAFLAHYRARHGGAHPDWRWVPYDRISRSLKRAVLVSEDLEFFSHRGFSSHEIKAALEGTLREGKPLRGASTLTQQLAKNLWLSPSRNPWRKLKEALLTYQLERHLSKRRILELYLNVAEFGPGVYGAEAAARRYFGRPAAALGSAQAAALAAALPSPDRWHPASGSQAAQRRAARIEARMRQAAWLEQLL